MVSEVPNPRKVGRLNDAAASGRLNGIMKGSSGRSASEATAARIEQFFGLSEAEIDHQIEEHKYFLNLTVPYEISRSEAFESWNAHVFVPLMKAIEDSGLENDFPELGQDELFIRVSEHWYFLKRDEDPNMPPERAVLSFGALHASDALSRAEYYLKL
jgi:hypothetical protein